MSGQLQHTSQAITPRNKEVEKSHTTDHASTKAIILVFQIITGLLVFIISVYVLEAQTPTIKHLLSVLGAGITVSAVVSYFQFAQLPGASEEQLEQAQQNILTTLNEKSTERSQEIK